MDINDIIKETKEQYSQNLEIMLEEVYKNIDSKKLLKNLPSIPRISRKRIVEDLKNSYSDDNLVFVLGAGISVEFNVPSWNDLLQKLMVFTIEEEKKTSRVLAKLFNEIFTPNPIIAGRYLQEYFNNKNKSFEEAVRDALYADVDKDKESKLLDEIINFCVAPGKSPNLNSIITYNFDDILEHRIRKIRIEIPFKSIYGIGMRVKNGELPIYHVHGYLPEKEKLNEDNSITLGENIYHKQYTDIYSWNNIVQINKFRDNTCLFIGSSLTDPNIRRLLDIAHRQKGDTKTYHYIFKKKHDVNRLIDKMIDLLDNKNILSAKNNANLNFDETIDLVLKMYERFEENDSASFGIKTIWINSYDEIPEILKEIRINVV